MDGSVDDGMGGAMHDELEQRKDGYMDDLNIFRW